MDLVDQNVPAMKFPLAAFPLKLVAIAAAAALSCASFSQATQVYMFAHQDDWPLFMGDKAYEDVSNNMPTVFICLTSGDAGMKTGGWGTIPYYRAREEASIHSIRLPSSLVTQWYPEDVWARVKVNNKSIMTCTHRNTVSYFFRIQDGSPTGAGYADNGYQSLYRLRAGLIPKVTSIDGYTVYKGWTDVVNTVKAILLKHGSGCTVNTHDYDPQYVPHTHSDHVEVGMIGKQASPGIASLMRYWVDYDTNNRPENLSTERIYQKFAMYGAHSATLSGYRYNMGWDDGHRAWLTRSYYREVAP